MRRLIFLIALTILASDYTAADDLQLRDFQDEKWGAPLSSFPDLSKKYTRDGTDYYSREGKFSLEGVAVDSVLYGFRKGELRLVELWGFEFVAAQSREGCNFTPSTLAFHRVLRKAYGPPVEEVTYIDLFNLYAPDFPVYEECMKYELSAEPKIVPDGCEVFIYETSSEKATQPTSALQAIYYDMWTEGPKLEACFHRIQFLPGPRQ